MSDADRERLAEIHQAQADRELDRFWPEEIPAHSAYFVGVIVVGFVLSFGLLLVFAR